jgi:outer membrane protein assembly factor BamB
VNPVRSLPVFLPGGPSVLVALVLLCAGCGGASAVTSATSTGSSVSHAAGSAPGPWDWPSYGHDAQHTFVGRTTLTPASAATLSKAWFFPTGDAVTASPTVVSGTVYVGSWDGNFYAISLATGRLDWKDAFDAQHGVKPYPGEVPRDITTDGGLSISSAYYEPGAGGRPDLVIVGAGYTLYAFDAHTGAVFWKHRYPSSLPPRPDTDPTNIDSSPVVFDGKVFFATAVNGQAGMRGRVIAASLATGDPVWIHELDISATGRILDNGCGDSWTSGSVIPVTGLVVFGTADCQGTADFPNSESIVALRTQDGSVAWSFRPSRPDHGCDFDFGASVNIGLDSSGHATFLGEGGKDGVYYSLDPADGQLRWSTKVVFGGSDGGFIGTPAYDGTRVYATTAFGDEGGGSAKACAPGNPTDVQMQNPAAHALDASNGSVLWEVGNVQSFGPTTVAGGMTFSGPALHKEVDVRDASTGALLVTLPIALPSWSGITTVGDAVVFGTGDLPSPTPAGIYAFTPQGAPPAVP